MNKRGSPRTGYPKMGRIQAGRVPATKLSEKDRNAIATLFLSGYNKGFLMREEAGDRIIWEVTFYKDE